jgi:hypothetical protein
MEPITVATAFASLIGLIRVYKAEVQEPEARDYARYLDWLRRQEHGQVVDLIEGNTDLARSVRDLIEDQHRQVMAKLELLDRILADVARNIDVFQPIADAVRVSQLSDQAVSVLRQMNAANSRKFLEIEMLSGTEYEMLDTEGAIRGSEPRFMTDDLLTLCELGLLRLELNGQGNRVFVITRAGAAVGGESK